MGHFGKERRLTDPPHHNRLNSPEDWFTGSHIGLFAGLEYHTKLPGLSIKADWGADRYSAETRDSDFSAPAPWALGLNYTPRPWLTIGGALVGGDKIMGRLSLQNPLAGWPGRAYKQDDTVPMRPYRTGLPVPAAMARSAARDNVILYNPSVSGRRAQALLEASPHQELPRQMRLAALHMSNHAGPDAEILELTPMRYGLSGPRVQLMRRDLERALTRHQGSAEEIWHNAEITTARTPPADARAQTKPFWRGLNDHLARPGHKHLHLVLDHQTSLSEHDNGLLHRTGLLLEEERKLSRRWMAGGALRLDLLHNLDGLNDYRARPFLPVRGDVDLFAQRRLGVERSFIGFTTSLSPHVHAALAAGYLEEMYAGIGGEMLYRPFGKRFALGAEAWQVFKRDPFTELNLGLSGDHLLTGHVQAWYEFPEQDMTLQFRLGRYLAEDIGGTLRLQKRFRSGLEMSAFVTATDRADFDVFGGQTHIYSGLALRLPLGNVKYLPEGAEIRARAAPFGRDSGQALDSPLPLYEMSEPLSYRHISQYWTQMLD